MARKPKPDPRWEALQRQHCKLIDEADRTLSRLLRYATRMKKIRKAMYRNLKAIEKHKAEGKVEGPF